MKEYKKILLCGAGKRGKKILSMLRFMGKQDRVAGFIDKDEEISDVDGLPVFHWKDVSGFGNRYEYIISIEDVNAQEDYFELLQDEQIATFQDRPSVAKMLGLSVTALNREIIAYLHVDSMDNYFDMAENSEYMDLFWREGTVFKTMFDKLDLHNVIELACGRGRHVPMYMNDAGHITLVDILQKNIDFCKERFKGNEKITLYKNDGYDLRELEDNSYSALFSYDAMVHFELLDIHTYLADINRVLKEGAKVLIHHSNHYDFFQSNSTEAVGWRSFMSDKIFYYLSEHSGFKVLDQEVIDWGGVKRLDCVTLIEKV